MESFFSFARLVFVTWISCGCYTQHVPFRVTSDPAGCLIEVNGVRSGVTPALIKLDLSRKHGLACAYPPLGVPLMLMGIGWKEGNETYNVVCYPPASSTDPMQPQTKVVVPAMYRDGDDLHYVFYLRPKPAATPAPAAGPPAPSVPAPLPVVPAPPPPAPVQPAVQKPEPPVDAPISRQIMELRKKKEAGQISEKEYREARQRLLDKP